MVATGAGLLLAGLQFGQGMSQMSHASDLMLAQGATDVLSSADLESARAMMAQGYVNVVMGAVGMGASAVGLSNAVRTGAIVTRAGWTARIALGGRQMIAVHESGMMVV